MGVSRYNTVHESDRGLVCRTERHKAISGIELRSGHGLSLATSPQPADGGCSACRVLLLVLNPAHCDKKMSFVVTSSERHTSHCGEDDSRLLEHQRNTNPPTYWAWTLWFFLLGNRSGNAIDFGNGFEHQPRQRWVFPIHGTGLCSFERMKIETFFLFFDKSIHLADFTVLIKQVPKMASSMVLTLKRQRFVPVCAKQGVCNTFYFKQSCHCAIFLCL